MILIILVKSIGYFVEFGGTVIKIHHADDSFSAKWQAIE